MTELMTRTLGRMAMPKIAQVQEHALIQVAVLEQALRVARAHDYSVARKGRQRFCCRACVVAWDPGYISEAPPLSENAAHG